MNGGERCSQLGAEEAERRPVNRAMDIAPVGTTPNISSRIKVDALVERCSIILPISRILNTVTELYTVEPSK